MHVNWKLVAASSTGFIVGVAITLLLAMSASQHWVSLSYVFLAEELRLDAGESSSAGDWRSAYADVTTVREITGRRGATWYWYFPLISWVGADYTMGPSGPHRVEDEAVAAYLAAKTGDVAQATASYSALVRTHPGSDEAAWSKYAINKLAVYKFQADAIRSPHTKPVKDPPPAGAVND